MRAQESLKFVEHLQAGFGPRQPMIFTAQFHQLVRLARRFERIGHHDALLKPHHCIILAVDQQNGCTYRGGQPSR